MQKLVLQKQESLTSLALKCNCLQEIDLTDCESLTNSICEVLSYGGGSPMLKSLVLDNCEVCVNCFYTYFFIILSRKVYSFEMCNVILHPSH